MNFSKEKAIKIIQYNKQMTATRRENEEELV